MRKLSIVFLSILSTGCATVPTSQQTDEQQYRSNQGKQLVTSLLMLGAVLYVANEVADSNRNKQCVGNKILYQGVSKDSLHICPGKLP